MEPTYQDQTGQPAGSQYPTLTMEAIAQRHPIWTAWRNAWRYYRDMYEGGVAWPGKLNPMQAQALSQPSIAGEMSGGGDFIPEKSPMGGAHGMVRYLWQNPVEKDVKFRHRLARAFYVNILAPVVDFYAAVIGKTDNWTYNGDEAAGFFGDADMQRQSFNQFMSQARTHAEVVGHTFIVCDCTRANGPLVTQADVNEQAIRPYLIEVLPENMLNWRLDSNGKPLEILYAVACEVPGTLADIRPQSGGMRYYYWSREYWQCYAEVASATILGDKVVELIDEGPHGLGEIPLGVLYHKRVQPFLGAPLIKDSAKIGHILSNWASALDEAFEGQMFAMPVLHSRKTPGDVGVGSTVVLHLNPEENEKFEYVSPETAPFEESWDAFYRLVELANKHMGIAPAAVGSGKVDTKSGVSKAWDFFESEKILARMAGNEQDTADALFKFAQAWNAGVDLGTISYMTKFDLATAEDDINDLISLQSARVPLTARKEMMRAVVFKKLPNLADPLRTKINAEINAMEDAPEPEAVPGGPQQAPGAPGGAPGEPTFAPRPVDRTGRPLIAPGAKAAPAA